MTERLHVEEEEEEGWEINELVKEVVAEKYYVGCFHANRSVTMKLIESLLCRVWGEQKECKVKKIYQERWKTIIGISCSSSSVGDILLEKGSWIFKIGILVLDKWPMSGKWQDANLNRYRLWVRETKHLQGYKTLS
ncbi:hypothetical protein POM88_029147 [Heracleum sosnowskyi]|uniref:DUF4283 domain-containing protein n=1 Tax=Heracleum sosnowskyi TaxID=360622 RepID=A0AAD8HT39_9APIA|nr:hypothetical protein POM88_029147 [Heracleum sosnowskyi]